MGANMKTSEVLNKAADLIEERGWVQGEWNAHVEDAPLCLEGGILAAMGVRAKATPAGMDRCSAYAAVRQYLELADNEHIYTWNDQSLRFDRAKTGETSRTAEEVIEVLRAAAVIEAAREAEPAKVSVA